MNDQKVINRFIEMCEESLDPIDFEKSEEIVAMLRKTRRSLEHKTFNPNKIIWEGDADIANKNFGEAYGIDWEYAKEAAK